MLLTLVFPLCQAGEGRAGESLLRAEDEDDENCHNNAPGSDSLQSYICHFVL